MERELRLLARRIAAALLLTICTWPAYAGADPVSPADRAVNQLKDARQAAWRAVDNDDCVLAEAAETAYDEAMKSYIAALDGGHIGEYESEVIDRIFRDIKRDLDELWADRFQKLLEKCDPSDPKPLQLGTEYEAAEVFRPEGNDRTYRAVPPGAWMPAPDPGQEALIGVGEMLDAVSTQQQHEADEQHVAPAPAPEPEHRQTTNPCSNE